MISNYIDKMVLALLCLEGVGRRTARKVAKVIFEENVTLDVFEELLARAIEQKLIRTQYNKNEIEIALSKVLKIEEQLDEVHGSYVSFMNTGYPQHLESINDPPALLFLRGNSSLLVANSNIAVIGTREPTDYAIKVGDRVVEVLVNAGYSIVSGLALGCDTIAHRGSLNHNGKTVAVLPSGLMSIYPRSNQPLASQILEHQGLLVTEYFPTSTPQKNFFVDRDRLQSALSKALFVLETDIGGGTMHTVRFARKENKPIACLLTHPAEFMSNPKLQGNLLIEKEKWGFAIRDKRDFDEFLAYLPTLRNKDRTADTEIEKNIDLAPAILDIPEPIPSVSKSRKGKKNVPPNLNQTEFPF